MVVPTLVSIVALALAVAGPSESPSVSRQAPSVPGAQDATPPLLAPELIAFEDAVLPVGTTLDADVAVVLVLDIDEDGLVSAVEIAVSAGEPFDGAAMLAAQGFVFEPAREGEVPIAVAIEYEYVFFAPEPEPATPPTNAPPTNAPPSAPGLDADAIEIDDAEVVRAPPVLRESSETRIEGRQAERIAGNQGDSIKAVSALGGVARPAVGSGAIIVWGAAPSDTRLYVDGMPVPRLLHIGGLRSVLPSPMVGSIALVPAAAGPAYGRAIGGMVLVGTRSPRRPSASRPWGAFARLDAFDAGAGGDAQLGKRTWVTAAVRRGLLADTVGPLLPVGARTVVPLPRYWDYQLRSDITVNSRDTLTLTALGSRDALARSIPSLTDDQRFSEQTAAGYDRVGLRLVRLRSDGSSMRLSAWGGHDGLDVQQRFPSADTRDVQSSWRGGARVSERRRLNRLLTTELGLDFELQRAELQRSGAITLPAREGDIVVLGQAPGNRVGQDAWTVHQGSAAAYGSLRLELDDRRWAIEPGLRVEPMVTVVDRILPVRPIDPEVGRTDVEVVVDPRLRARFRPWSGLSLFAAGGRYHQAASPTDLSPIFGNPQLGAVEALHGLAGARVNVPGWASLEATGFWTQSQSVTIRSADPTPSVAAVLVDEGHGRNLGVQVRGRASIAQRWTAQLSYAWIRAERRRDAKQPWRRFDFDQPHTVTALGGWRHRTGIELAGRVDISSGHPRTAVVDAVQDTVTGAFDPVFGQHNATRLPTFFQVSLRAAWSRAWLWGHVTTWLDLSNVTNHRNVADVFYSADYTQRGFVRGLPILPSLGVEVRL